ncbi:MAG TPA: hypothetical protein VFK38_09085 [Candidatus Limnocylindrales bacterium]|nr:hypothetical protein [Candidatus Limnocylindrales bacterium]
MPAVGSLHVVLRVQTTRGCLGLCIPPPAFTLYADGALVLRGPSEVTESPTGYFPFIRGGRLTITRLTRTEVSSLLQVALRMGGLATAERRYERAGRFSTEQVDIWIDGGAISRHVSVRSSFEPGRLAPASAQAIGRLLALSDFLLGFRPGHDSSSATTAVLLPAEYLVTFSPTDDIGNGGGPTWPWPEVGLDRFRLWRLPDGTVRCGAVITAEQHASLDPGATGGVVFTQVHDPRDWVSYLTTRPLLPDERLVRSADAPPFGRSCPPGMSAG